MNCLQRVCSSGQGVKVCKSCATHQALITCNMSCAMWYEGTAQLLSLTELSCIYCNIILAKTMSRVASRARDCRKNIGMPAKIQTCCGKKTPNPEKCRKRKDRLKSRVTVVCITFRKQRTTSVLIGSFQPINGIRFHLPTSSRLVSAASYG